MPLGGATGGLGLKLPEPGASANQVEEPGFYTLRFGSFMSKMDESALRDAATFGEPPPPSV